MASKIDWCDETLNPLGWGCWGPGGTEANPKRCHYCYAEDFAHRRLRKVDGKPCPLCAAFIPHWHPGELDKPRHWRRPRRIFVCSMSDLLHPETPAEHIQACIEVAEKCPHHTFIFLTKNPERYREFTFPENSLLGATATHQATWDRAIEPGLVDFISVEPLLSEIKPHFIEHIRWLILGADSTRGAKKPRREWGANLIAAATEAGVPVFVKKNWPFAGEWPHEFANTNK